MSLNLGFWLKYILLFNLGRELTTIVLFKLLLCYHPEFVDDWTVPMQHAYNNTNIDVCDLSAVDSEVIISKSFLPKPHNFVGTTLGDIRVTDKLIHQRRTFAYFVFHSNLSLYYVRYYDQSTCWAVANIPNLTLTLGPGGGQVDGLPSSMRRPYTVAT